MSAMDPSAPYLDSGLAGAGPATDCTRLSGPPPSGNRGEMYSGYLFPGKSKAQRLTPFDTSGPARIPFSNFPKWDRQRGKIRLTDGRHLWGRRFGCSELPPFKQHLSLTATWGPVAATTPITPAMSAASPHS